MASSMAQRSSIKGIMRPKPHKRISVVAFVAVHKDANVALQDVMTSFNEYLMKYHRVFSSAEREYHLDDFENFSHSVVYEPFGSLWIASVSAKIVGHWIEREVSHEEPITDGVDGEKVYSLVGTSPNTKPSPFDFTSYGGMASTA